MSTVAKSTRSYSGFDPRTIGNCILWLDAGDSNTFTFSSGSNVLTWVDKSSNVTFTQGGTASRLTRTTYQGYPTIFFDSSDSTTNAFMTGSLGLPSAVSVLQVITVLPYNDGTWGFLWSWNTGESGRVPGLRSSNASPDFQPYITFLGNNGNRVSITQGTRYVQYVDFRNSGANTTYAINALTPTAGTLGGTNFSPSTFILGGDGPTTPTIFGRFYLSELIMFSGQLGTYQRQLVEGYLAWKWGMRTNMNQIHPYYQTPIVTRAFQPTDISGLFTWMDGADPATMTISGSNITQWRDKSGTGLIFSNQIATQAIYSSNLINGLPGVNLTNGSGFISSTSPVKSLNLSWAGVVVVKSGIANWGSIFTHGGRDLDFAVERNSISGGTTRIHFQTANDNVGCDITYVIDRVDLYLGTMTNGTSRFFERIGGGTDTSSSATNSLTMSTAGSNIRIGRSDGGEAFNSHIGEIVYYNRVITDIERQYLESYLTDKWKITGLRSSNIFFNKRFLPLTPAFTPNAISNCFLWLDAADPASIILGVGSNITTWRDKSGRSCNATAVNAPTYSSNTAQVNFSRSSSQYFTLGDGTLPTGNSGYAYFMLASFAGDAGIPAYTMISGGCNTVTRGTFYFGNMSGTSTRTIRTEWNADGFQSGTSIYAPNSNSIFSSLYNPGLTSLQRTMSINGILVASNTPGGVRAQTNTNNAIGAFSSSSGASAYLTGTISEIIVYSNALTPSQIYQVEGYLAWKWNLRIRLPTSHPYYEITP